eukprot:g11501.t1
MSTGARRQVLENVPSLSRFHLRCEALALYRSVFRKTRGLDADKRKEVHQFARQQFENVRKVSEEHKIRWLLAEGKLQSINSSAVLTCTKKVSEERKIRWMLAEGKLQVDAWETMIQSARA